MLLSPILLKEVHAGIQANAEYVFKHRNFKFPNFLEEPEFGAEKRGHILNQIYVRNFTLV
tara:strand:- start:32 stop:211 length:180 start_codon:yes stop_codon:yes gene_type:complete